jgi:hypothetical protein
MAQDNYEIQVYGSDTVAKGHTMFELHSNYTFSGSRSTVDGVRPSQYAFHETLEITRGITDNFETGFYLFNAHRSDYGWQVVGSHIRPRIKVPDSYKWPVGASLSAEVGYQRNDFSNDTWTVELRPIFDKQIKAWYFAFNPTFDQSLAGANAARGWTFSPNIKISNDITKKITLGVEYYGSVGPITGFDPRALQQHQIFPSIDLNLGPDWEFNAGIGFGLSGSTDRTILKFIIGRRFNW